MLRKLCFLTFKTGVGFMKIVKSDWIDELEDPTFFSEDGREMLLDEDELSPEEVGFMQGYDEAS